MGADLFRFCFTGYSPYSVPSSGLLFLIPHSLSLSLCLSDLRYLLNSGYFSSLGAEAVSVTCCLRTGILGRKGPAPGARLVPWQHPGPLWTLSLSLWFKLCDLSTPPNLRYKQKPSPTAPRRPYKVQSGQKGSPEPSPMSCMYDYRETDAYLKYDWEIRILLLQALCYSMFTITNKQSNGNET